MNCFCGVSLGRSPQSGAARIFPFDSPGSKVTGLEDRMVQRTELLCTDIAGLKAESAIEQAYGRDTAEALRRRIADRNAHGPRAA